MPRMVPWKKYLEGFIQEYQDCLVSEITIVAYRRIITMIFKKYGEGLPNNPRKWTSKEINIFWGKIKHLSPSTQLHYLTILRLFIIFSGNTRISKVRLRIKPVRSNVRWLDPDQIGLLLSTAPDIRTYALEVLMAYTGLRRSEVVVLRVNQVQEKSLSVIGKRRKQRNIPLTKDFWEAIQPYLVWRQKEGVRSEFFLVHQDQSSKKFVPYSVQSLTQMVSDHGRVINLDVSPHDLRRSFGRLLWVNGCDVVLIKEILGHESVEQTIRYLGINQYDLQKARDYYPKYEQKMYLTKSSQE